MAEINIEPRKKSPIWPWILGVLLLGGIIWFLTRDRDREPATTPVAVNNDAEASGNRTDADMWRDVDLNAPRVERPELKITSPDFEVRGTDQYTIYSLGENLLFDSDQAALRADAEQNLKQIAASIKQRYAGGQVRLYGFTDAQAGENYNKELSEKRAEAVKNWLVTNAEMDASKVMVHPMGESAPIASNQTEEGRQQNRRVQIVAMSEQASQNNQQAGQGNQ